LGEITMEEKNKKPELYSLPFIMHSSYKFGMHLLLLIFIILFAAIWFFPDIFGIIFRLFSLTLSLFLAYMWIYIGILKKVYVKLTEDEISFKTMFGLKTIKWTDIAYVETFSMGKNLLIGIISKEKLKKRKENFLTAISDLYGGEYSLSIPLQNFPEAKPEKLYSTIFNIAQEKYRQNCSEEEIMNISSENNVEDKQIDNSFVTPIIMALIVSLISGAIYGLSIYLLKNNFIVIPFLGMIAIEYAYYKTCQEKRTNIFMRFYVGILCVLQIFAALLTALLMENTNLIKVIGIWNTISDCVKYIVKYPKEYDIYYILGVIIFFFGAFSGYSSKITRKIGKIFMKKQNGFCIKREKPYVSIYLIDYAEYNKDEEKYALRIDPNVCLIEKNKKNVLAFYIPEALFESFSISEKKFEKISFCEKMYYKLDLGGNGEMQPYGFSGLLIINKYKHLELIKLEID
jgi:hypothetical protein